MARTDIGASGVAFTLDTESGFSDAVFITSSVGLGECVVQGAVNPDEFYVHKPTLLSGRPAILRRHLGSKLINVEEPPKTPMFLDAEIVNSNWLAASNFEQRVRDQESEWRHENGINVVYWDGHVEFIEDPTYNKVFKIAED